MSDNPNSILMTQAQYARHRNKSPQCIANLAKAGVLVKRGRMVFLGSRPMVEGLLSRLRHYCHTVHIDGPSLRVPQG